MLVFCFLLVFMFNVSFLYLANVIYWPISLKTGYLSQKGKKAGIVLLLFFCWCSFSVLYYVIGNDAVGMRSIVQMGFTAQYLLLCISWRVNYKKLGIYLYYFGILLAVYIICLFLILGKYKDIDYVLAYDRLWAQRFVPSFPNGICLSLIMALWISVERKKGFIGKCLIVLACLLTTSRTALLGCAMVILYWFYSMVKKNKKYLFLLVGFLLFVLAIGVMICKIYFPAIWSRLFYMQDRLELVTIVMHFIKLRPLTGFGGNTLYQLYEPYEFMPETLYQHSHNLFLEIMLRYGVIGFILFFTALLILYRDIDSSKKKFIFVVFLFLGLFQIYIRDFVYLFYLSYCINDTYKGAYPKGG